MTTLLTPTPDAGFAPDLDAAPDTLVVAELELLAVPTSSRVLLVDLDGTVADFEAQLSAEMAELSDGRFVLSPDQQVSRSARDDYLAAFGPTARDLADQITASPGFYRRLPLIDGAADALSTLSADLGWTVVFCTAPSQHNPTCGHDKFAWVDSHFGADAATRMVVTKDKTLVHGRYLIDDRPQDGTLTPSWRQIFYDAPHNRSFGGARLFSWPEAVSHPLLTSEF